MDGVEESAVIGVPDPDFGEAVTAVVVGKPGIADRGGDHRRAEGRDRQLQGTQARYFVAGLPRNAMGKVQKAVLREQLAAS